MSDLSTVPAPGDATEVHEWAMWDEHDWRRSFLVTARETVSGIDGELSHVSTWGEQAQTGDVTRRWVHVDAGGGLTGAQCRALAALLLSAADRLDSLEIDLSAFA